MELKGIKAKNPYNGKLIPIFISDYVLMGYGTGAIMAVPAHDQRDYDFAKAFNLPIIQVLAGGDIAVKAHEEDGAHINSEFLDGMNKEDGMRAAIDYAVKHGFGKSKINYKLRDWVFSRQRYWGEPIPMVYCEHCGWQPIPESELPLTLPPVPDYHPNDEANRRYQRPVTSGYIQSARNAAPRPAVKRIPCRTGPVLPGISCVIAIRTTAKNLPPRKRLITG